MKKCTRCVSSHFKKHGIKYVLGVSTLVIVKGILSLAMGIGFFSLTTHASYDPATVCASITDIPQSECYALVDFYNATDGDNWGDHGKGSMINSGWLQGTGACYSKGLGWLGLSCNKDNHVIRLNLSIRQNDLQRGPIDLTALPYLTSLTLGNFYITSLDITGLTGLTILNISNKDPLGGEISSLDLSGFVNLTDISLAGNQLSSISLGEMPNLVNLVLDRNNLTSFDITGFPMLSSLQIRSNPLTTLNLSNLTLKWLGLDNTLLTSVSFSGLDIAKLDLASGSLQSLELTNFPSLTYLDIKNNPLTTLKLTNLPLINTLDAENTHLTNITLTGLSSLSILNLKNAGLTDFDCPLPSLFQLILAGNELTVFDAQGYTNLNSLDLSGNKLTEIKNLSSLTNLGVLMLDNNPLGGILDINALTNLRHLYANNDNLSGIDGHLLTDFEQLHVNYNHITLDSLGLPSRLHYLEIYNNELSGDWDLTAYPLNVIWANDNHLTNVDFVKDTIIRVGFSENNLTTFDFSGFSPSLTSFWLGGNQISGDLEEMGFCNLPFTGREFSADCVSPEDMGNGSDGCFKISLSDNYLYGDVPTCVKDMTNLNIDLEGNMLNIYDTSGEVKYTGDMLTWLNNYAAWPTSKKGGTPTSWMNQKDNAFVSDLYILPSITTKGTIGKGDTINIDVNFGNLGPNVAIPGSRIVISFGGIDNVVPSAGSFQTSRGVVGDSCYDDFLQGTGVYAQAMDAASEAMVAGMAQDNGNGTVSVTLGKGQTVTFAMTDLVQNSTGLSKYFAFMAEVMGAVGNTEIQDLVLNGLTNSGAYVAFEYFCKAGVFNNGLGYSSLAECLQSPWTPNMGSPIQLSGFDGCGISSLIYTLGGLPALQNNTFTISARVQGDIIIGSSIVNSLVDGNLWNNYGYYTMNLTTQKVFGSGGFLYFSPEFIAGAAALKRASVAESTGGSVEVPADTKIIASGDWNGALYAPMDTSNSSCDLANIINRFTVGATGDSASLLASGGTYFKITRYVGTEYNDDILAIYVSNGAPCTLNQPDSTGLVVSGYITFNAVHLSDFSLVVAATGDNGGNNNGGNNNGGSDTGGPFLTKDQCPTTRDCSNSYYDQVCGKCSTPTLWNKITNLFHPNASKIPASIAGSTYTTEINNAYLWAYDLGITTIPTIQKANIEGTLLRSHLAKMLSQYAINVLGLKENTGANCIFNDMATQSKEMQYYAIQACRLGLMGVGIKNFSPDKEVDRATFGTTLSRALYGSENDVAGSRYYSKHLQALKDAGIMTKITSPFMKEIRGYVMLMLMRAEQK